MAHFKSGLGVGSMALLALGGAVACGSDFSGDDGCKTSRTCAVGGSESGAGADGSGDAGSESMESGGESSTGGPHDAGGQAGGAPVACAGPEDCDDDNAENGQESCGAEGACVVGNPPPAVLSVFPDVNAVGIQPGVAIELTFSEPLDPASVTPTSVQVLDGQEPLAGELVHEGGKVTFAPSDPLPLMAELRINVSTGVTDVEGASLLAAYTSTFTTRDGVWSVSDVNAGGRPYVLSNTVPMTAKGDALVSWISSTDGAYCPAAARWFNGGSPVALTKSFPVEQSTVECYDIAAGANSAGVAAVAWREETSGNYVAQYRESTWAPASLFAPTSMSNTTRRAVGVAPNGVISAFMHGPVTGTFVRSTNLAGDWGEVARDIAKGHAGMSAVGFAFDSQSDGFAAWRAEVSGKDEVLVARYTFENGWVDATPLPGSAATTTSPDNERGAPAIAVDNERGAMAVWVREANAADKGSLVASRYTAAGGWEAPVALSGALSVTHVASAPGLVFDGTTYVVAWTAKDGATFKTYSSRYDAQSSEWDSYELRSASASLDRMPSLGADAHQNLLMTWMTGDGAQPTIAYARFNARTGEWSDELDFPGGVVKLNIAEGRPVPLGVAANGHAALAWFDRDGSGTLSTIRLASFY
jgi:hypothetical protein